ncbi:MAG TPA: hypothetical protein VGU23_01500 [Acidobacteriaceae bacterium]|nr:hypothetical protein [Acidobacteriaceae bacterium]
MRGSEANMSAFDPWTALLQQTRDALSLLRAEDLEDLAGRAECMLEATIGDSTVRQRMRGPQKERMGALAKERGLLQSLLGETDRNLKVVRHMRQDGRTSRRSGEVDSRWVR